MYIEIELSKSLTQPQSKISECHIKICEIVFEVDIFLIYKPSLKYDTLQDLESMKWKYFTKYSV